LRAYQPDRIVISAAGNLEHEPFADLVTQSFDVVRRLNNFPERIQPVLRQTVTTHIKDLEQVHVCLRTQGVKTTDKRRYDFAVLNVILGGNMSSRLFQEIREKRGLAYSVYSFLSLYSDTGTWGVYVGCDNTTTSQVIELSLKEMRNIKTQPVDSAELANAKEYLRGGLYMAAESTENQMTRIAQNEINFGRFVSLKEVEREIDNVTAEGVMALAEEVFHDETLSLMLLGPVDESADYKDQLHL
jgi:predicted Zn-dependent peptidase